MASGLSDVLCNQAMILSGFGVFIKVGAITLRLLLILRQAICDFIIIAFTRHKDMARQLGVGWRFECAHRDANPVMFCLVKGVIEK